MNNQAKSHLYKTLIGNFGMSAFLKKEDFIFALSTYYFLSSLKGCDRKNNTPFSAIITLIQAVFHN